MLRARYGRLWILAALAIILIIFSTGLTPAVPVKAPAFASWFPSREQQKAFKEMVLDAPAIDQLAPGLVPPSPLNLQPTTTPKTEEAATKISISPSSSSSSSSSTSTAPAIPTPIPEEPIAEVAADTDRDLLAEHKALAEQAAADIDDGAQPDEHILTEVATDMDDDYTDDEAKVGTNAAKTSHTTPGSLSAVDLEHLDLDDAGFHQSESANGLESTTSAEAAVMIQTAPSTPTNTKTPSMAKRSKTVVVGRLHSENTHWIEEELADWQSAIYYVDLPDDAVSPTGLRTRMNKAREAMPYLTYIIDHYPDFPDVAAFIHPHQETWHNDAKYQNAVNMLRDLKLSTVQLRGYVNLRCIEDPGCPGEIHPFRKPADPRKPAENAFSSVYAELFQASEAEMRKQIPVVGTPCCAQFAVSREQLLKRPKADYERYRDYLEQTEYDDDTIGRVMEYMWHMIFGREAVHCEDMFECWCAVYGRCFSSELDKSWTGWLGLTEHPKVEGPQDY